VRYDFRKYRLDDTFFGADKCLAHANIAVLRSTAIAATALMKCTSTVMTIHIASTVVPAVMVIAPGVHLKFTSTGAEMTNASIVA